MTSFWVLWKTYYWLLLKKCLWPCPGPSIYLSERIYWIISSFPRGISKIVLDLGSLDNFGRLGSRIRDGPFHMYLKFETRGVDAVLGFSPVQNQIRQENYWCNGFGKRPPRQMQLFRMEGLQHLRILPNNFSHTMLLSHAERKITTNKTNKTEKPFSLHRLRKELKYS